MAQFTILTPDEIEDEFSTLKKEDVWFGFRGATTGPYFDKAYDALWRAEDIRMVRMAIGYYIGFSADEGFAFYYRDGESSLRLFIKDTLLDSLRDMFTQIQLGLSYNEAGCSCDDCAVAVLDTLCLKNGISTYDSYQSFCDSVWQALDLPKHTGCTNAMKILPY